MGIQEVVRESCDYPVSLIQRWEEAVALNIKHGASGEDLIYAHRNVRAKQMEVARTTASAARLLYHALAEEIRAMASMLVRRNKGDISDVDCAERAAKVSAKLHDIPRELFALNPSVTLVLIHPEPDSANKMSISTLRQKNVTI